MDGGIQPKCYGDTATCHPNERKHCMKTFFNATILGNLFQNSVQNVIEKFLSFYASDSPKWENISKLAKDLNWASLVNTTTEEYLLAQGVSEKYIGEVVEAATRVNYGQVWRFNF